MPKKGLIKIINIIFISFITLSSCYHLTPVDLNNSAEYNTLVINGLLNPNDSINLFLHKVNSMEEIGFSPISDASIMLFEDNTYLCDLDPDSTGNYKSDFIPQYGKEYQIEIEHEQYESLSAETHLPFPVLVDSTLFKKNAGTSFLGDNYSETTIYFTDPPNEVNYYEIIVFCTWQDWLTKDVAYDNDIYFPYTMTDPVLSNSGCLDNNSNFAYFSDELIDGQSYSLNIHTLMNTAMMSSNFQYFVCFKSVTKEMYLYHKSMTNHLYHQSGLALEFLIIDPGNPVNMYSNIEGGLGIFAGYHDQLIEIEI